MNKEQLEHYQNKFLSLKKETDLKPFVPEFKLVLSGGSAKGFTHLGIIGGLEKCGIKPELVVGTSAGSLVGALYAYYMDSKQIIDHIAKFQETQIFQSFSKKYFTASDGKHPYRKFTSWVKMGLRFTKALVNSSMIDFDDMYTLYKALLTPLTTSNLKIPFYACATDFLMGKPQLFNEGDLVLNIMASTAIPGIFPLIPVNDSFYTDGGITAHLPANIAKHHFDSPKSFFCGVDVGAPVMLHEFDEKSSPVNTLLRVIDIALKHKSNFDREKTHFTFCPIDKEYEWDEFEQYNEFINVGKSYFSESIPYFFEAYTLKIYNLIKTEKNILKRIRALKTLKKYSSF